MSEEMTELDKKLLAILQSIKDMSERPVIEEFVAGMLVGEIEQAFAEAGYIAPPTKLYAMPKGKDLAREFAGLEQIVNNETQVTELDVMMTGKEFFDRFEKDISSIPYNPLRYHEIMEAAKRAAGLDQ